MKLMDKIVVGIYLFSVLLLVIGLILFGVYLFKWSIIGGSIYTLIMISSILLSLIDTFYS